MLHRDLQNRELDIIPVNLVKKDRPFMTKPATTIFRLKTSFLTGRIESHVTVAGVDNVGSVSGRASEKCSKRQSARERERERK